MGISPNLSNSDKLKRATCLMSVLTSKAMTNKYLYM